jgi:hypothetical protein
VISATSVSVRDYKFRWTEPSGGGPFRDVAPQVRIAFTSDSGFDLFSWWLDADVESFNER